MLDERSSELFEELRTLRKQLADAVNKPAYIVFSDATLKEMATARPRNREEMLLVSGVGPAKWERYGEEFLAAVLAFSDREGPRVVADGSRPSVAE